LPHFRDVAMVAWMKLPRQEILRLPGVLPSSCWLHRLVTQCSARRGQRSLQVAATVAVAAAGDDRKMLNACSDNTGPRWGSGSVGDRCVGRCSRMA
jgi:hypothetical protein